MTTTPRLSAAANGNPKSPFSFAVAAGLVHRTPYWLLYAASRVGGRIHYCMDVRKRRNYRANLGPLRLPHRHRPWHAFQNQALNVLELLKSVYQREEELRSGRSLNGGEIIRSALSRGNGLILVTMHTGNWEMAGLTLALRGYPLTTVAGEQLRGGWSEPIKRLKKRSGIKVVGNNGGVRELFRDLRDNRVVALHFDGNLFTGGYEVVFLGRRIRVPRGPARLSRITGAPVAFAFSRRTGRKQLDVIIEKEESAPISDDDEYKLTQRLATRVERHIAEAPGQWCIFRRLGQS